MKRFITICWLFALSGGLLFGAGTGEDKTAQSEAAALEEILELEGAALDTWYGDSDPAAYAQSFADKATYFDPWSAGKLEDSAVKEYLMAFAGLVPKLHYEILNPRVDLYGDTAVFTCNLDATNRKDSTVTQWNVAAIFTRTRDGWEKVYASWSFKELGS